MDSSKEVSGLKGYYMVDRDIYHTELGYLRTKEMILVGCLIRNGGVGPLRILHQHGYFPPHPTGVKIKRYSALIVKHYNKGID